MNVENQISDILEQVIAAAKIRKLTHGQLSLKWGITKSYVSVIMRRARKPHIELLDNIVGSMGLSATIRIGSGNINNEFYSSIKAFALSPEHKKRIEESEELSRLFTQMAGLFEEE